MIYQEPMASLNPAMKVGQQLMEVPLIHDKVSEGRGLRAGAGNGATRCGCPIPSA